MKLACLQENLSGGLSVVGRAVATRTTLPITQNVLISTDEGRLKLASTNLEIAISTWIGAQIEEEGSITVPARLLTEFVNSLPAERIDLNSTDQPTILALQCARFDAKINGSDPEDFPPIPKVDSGVVVKVDATVLRDAISHVAFAAATEDSRPVLTGIKVEISADEVTFVATDGFRLAVYKGNLSEAAAEDSSFIIPAKALQEVSRLIGPQEKQIEFTVTPSQSQALFRIGGTELVTQLVQGTFPNYSQIIPPSYDTRVTVNLGEFHRATRAASIFARDVSGIVRIQVLEGEDQAPGRVSIQSRAEEVGENLGEIEAKVEGGESKIAFNSQYLSEVLGILEQGEVALETTTPSSPGVLRPVGKENYIHVIMPMFVQW